MKNTVLNVAKISLCALSLSASAAFAGLPDGPVEGFGNDLPLDEVVHEIVPGTIKINIADAVDSSQPISWQGGASWKASLKGALVNVGLIAKFSEKGVLIDVAPPPPQKWEILDGETVAQTVLRWSKQAGYTPVPQFAAQDRWRIFVNQSFDGSFDEALDWLSQGFSRQPTKPVFFLGTNKTIDIISQATGATPATAGMGRY